jgi:hypothetical protein
MILVGKPEENPRRLTRRLEDNIKTDLQENRWEGCGLQRPVSGYEKVAKLVDMVTNLRVLQNAWLAQELLVSPFQKVSYSCNLLFDALTAHLLTPLTRTTLDCPESKQEHFRRRFSDET